MKILDCTLREGGYYTNWDFEKKIVENYSKSMQKLPIDFIEIGYRNPKLKGYYGEYYYCKLSTIEFIQQFTNKNLAIILNEKDVDSSIIHDLINVIDYKIVTNGIYDDMNIGFCSYELNKISFTPTLVIKLKKIPNISSSIINVIYS